MKHSTGTIENTDVNPLPIKALEFAHTDMKNDKPIIINSWTNKLDFTPTNALLETTICKIDETTAPKIIYFAEYQQTITHLN